MPDIRKCRWLLGLVTVFVLLSFLHTVPFFAVAPADIALGYDAVWAAEAGFAEMAAREPGEPGFLRADAITARDNSLPGGMDSIFPAKAAAENIVTREQTRTRTLLIRFVVIVFTLILAVRVICRILSRRYGCHMIEVWQNIYYIHQVDGKKGERFSVYIG